MTFQASPHLKFYLSVGEYLFKIYLTRSPLTICKVRPLGEAQLIAVLCLTGIHGLGISVQTIKVNKDMGSFRRGEWNQLGGMVVFLGHLLTATD